MGLSGFDIRLLLHLDRDAFLGWHEPRAPFGDDHASLTIGGAEVADDAYMDDFILVHEDKEYLRQCKKEIEARLFALGLQLNDKTALYPLRQGVKLLQWRFIVTDTGAIIRKMGKKKQSKQRRKLKKLYAKERRGEYAPGTAHESLVSWLANAARGDTYHERLKMINYFKNMEATYNAREYL